MVARRLTVVPMRVGTKLGDGLFPDPALPVMSVGSGVAGPAFGAPPGDPGSEPPGPSAHPVGRHPDPERSTQCRGVGPRLKRALLSSGLDWELVFVDDSDDSTCATIRQAMLANPEICLVHRVPGERQGGLGGAVSAGFEVASGEVVAVMDADLQHPPEVLAAVIAPVLSGEAGLVAGNRYAWAGGSSGLSGWSRHLVSWSCPRFGACTGAVQPPLGGPAWRPFRRCAARCSKVSPFGPAATESSSKSPYAAVRPPSATSASISPPARRESPRLTSGRDCCSFAISGVLPPRTAGSSRAAGMSSSNGGRPNGCEGFNVLLTTITALLAAALFGVSTALQHRSAGLVSDGSAGNERLGGFMARTLRHPFWIVGAIADIGGFALHALALHLGPLTVVQPLLVSSIVFAVIVRQLLERRWPRRSELAWAGALTLGLVLFLSISTPTGLVAQPADPVPAAVVGVLIGFGVLGFFVGGRRCSGSAAAALLGTATGLTYAALAGLLKEDTSLLDHGVRALAVSWSLYALIAVGAFSIVANQLAYKAGPLARACPPS